MPGRALPAYRYVPGLNPHPFRHPAGHSWVGGAAPPAPVWDGGRLEVDWGLELFAHRHYWECHEHYEGLWRQVPRDSVESAWFQGFVQAAAAVLQRHVGEERAALSLLAAATPRLRRAAGRSLAPDLDLEALLRELEGLREGVVYPRLWGPA